MLLPLRARRWFERRALRRMRILRAPNSHMGLRRCAAEVIW